MCAVCQRVKAENVHWFGSRRIIYTEISKSSLGPFSIPVLGLTACEAIALSGYHTGMKQKLEFQLYLLLAGKAQGYLLGGGMKNNHQRINVALLLILCRRFDLLLLLQR